MKATKLFLLGIILLYGQIATAQADYTKYFDKLKWHTPQYYP